MPKSEKSSPNFRKTIEKLPWSDVQWWMGKARDEAVLAGNVGEVPVGCVIVSDSGELLAQTHNNKEATHNPCGHAEILAMQMAAERLKDWRLNHCHLIVSLEPCLMCLGAMVQARVGRLYFGAYDPKGGALSLGHQFSFDHRLNHNFPVMGGVQHYQNSKLLSDFFRARRNTH